MHAARVVHVAVCGAAGVDGVDAQGCAGAGRERGGVAGRAVHLARARGETRPGAAWAGPLAMPLLSAACDRAARTLLCPQARTSTGHCMKSDVHVDVEVTMAPQVHLHLWRVHNSNVLAKATAPSRAPAAPGTAAMRPRSQLPCVRCRRALARCIPSCHARAP